jgi:hypothetical protein
VNPQDAQDKEQACAEQRGTSNTHTIAKPGPDPTLMTSSTGSKATMPKATAPVEVSTPIRFHNPDQTTA